jgi:hypothetical protein
MSEAFVYLWYDSKNRMYYLGYHKGTLDDGYTHSSSVMESFKSHEVPPYMKRRILAYGTHEEMMVLENKLLVNRKAKKWDKYYNRSLGDLRVITLLGEDNPNYTHGYYSEEKIGTEEAKEFHRVQTSKWLDKRREENPDYSAVSSKSWRERNPKKFKKSYDTWYQNNRERKLFTQKQLYNKKKLEKEQANSTSLDGFMS